MSLNEDLEEFRIENTNILERCLDEFLEITNHDELMIVILRAHLYIERELTNLLAKIFVDNNYINLTFSQKVDLCISLSLINTTNVGAIKKLNKQRNGYAHKLDYSLTNKDYQDLISTLPKESKVMCEDDSFFIGEGEITLTDRYRLLLAVIWAEIKFDSFYFFYNHQKRHYQILKNEVVYRQNEIK